MRKNCDKGRFILSKRGADEQIFLSDVIKSFLRRMAQMRRCFLTKCTIWVGDDKNTKQMSHYAQETGRSMVEMLGVLAIIGVLSVGGIAGYSKAMRKHKLNKHAESFNMLLNTAIQQSEKAAHVVDFIDGNGTVWYTETFYKAGFAPDGLEISQSSIYLKDMFDNEIWLFYNPPTKRSGIGYSFTSDELDICYNLIDVVRANSFQLQYVTTDIRDMQTQISTSNGQLYGDAYCTDNVKCLKTMTISDIDTLCNSCLKTSSSCRFYILYY